MDGVATTANTQRTLPSDATGRNQLQWNRPLYIQIPSTERPEVATSQIALTQREVATSADGIWPCGSTASIALSGEFTVGWVDPSMKLCGISDPGIKVMLNCDHVYNYEITIVKISSERWKFWEYFVSLCV